jgi:short-subunit dehydrogenase
MTKMLLDKMKSRNKSGDNRSLVINLASTAAGFPFPDIQLYSGTKVFDGFFSEALYFELKQFKIDVLTVKPGLVCTNMTNNAIIDHASVTVE